MVNSSQSKVAEYRYDPFGNLISKSGSLADANVYRFSSKEIHANSGMYYFLYRFYDPNLQRWINRDPLGDGVNPLLKLSRHRSSLGRPIRLSSGHFEGMGNPNLYAFVRNVPIR